MKTLPKLTAVASLVFGASQMSGCTAQWGNARFEVDPAVVAPRVFVTPAPAVIAPVRPLWGFPAYRFRGYGYGLRGYGYRGCGLKGIWKGCNNRGGRNRNGRRRGWRGGDAGDVIKDLSPQADQTNVAQYSVTPESDDPFLENWKNWNDDFSNGFSNDESPPPEEGKPSQGTLTATKKTQALDLG